MPDSDQLASSILFALNTVILKRNGPREYEFVGQAPEFYQRFFPPDQDGPCRAPWEYSPLLEFFLDDAEEFFESKTTGSLSSGLWQEDDLSGEQEALVAEAMCIGDSKVITIRLLTGEFASLFDVMCLARQNLLDTRNLCQDLEIYKDRASVDHLTKVLSRSAFNESLEKAIAYANTSKTPLSMALLDIDNFKTVNDTYGHQSGDEVLTTIGELLCANLRRDDAVGRYGGDEFLLLTPSTGGQIMNIAEKLRANVAAHSFESMPKVTISVGCTTYIHGEDIEQLFKRADEALYDSKRKGRNTVSFR